MLPEKEPFPHSASHTGGGQSPFLFSGIPRPAHPFCQPQIQVNTLHILREICQEFIQMDYKPSSLQKRRPWSASPCTPGDRPDQHSPHIWGWLSRSPQPMDGIWVLLGFIICLSGVWVSPGRLHGAGREPWGVSPRSGLSVPPPRVNPRGPRHPPHHGWAAKPRPRSRRAAGLSTPRGVGIARE